MTTPNDVPVDSWKELIDELYAGSYHADIGRYRSNFAFRGLSRAKYSLETSLMRQKGNHAKMETCLIRNFRKYGSLESLPIDTQWHTLTMAQHHGLPTRLLDWTFSPFVAMHFATENPDHFNEDGAIWCVDFCETNKRLPTVFQEALEREWAVAFTVEMLSSITPTLQQFDNLDPGKKYVLFFEPPSMDARIINQYALLSVMPDPNGLLHEWLRTNRSLYKRIIIKAGLKWEIRDKLDQANINERIIYPGLDGLARWLKRHYSSK